MAASLLYYRLCPSSHAVVSKRLSREAVLQRLIAGDQPPAQIASKRKRKPLNAFATMLLNIKLCDHTH